MSVRESTAPRKQFLRAGDVCAFGGLRSAAPV